MNTNKLKSFATKARLILMEGVSRKLNYWGFNDRGECVQEMEPIVGGYEFREQVFNDPRVYPKWQNLKQHIRDQQTRKDVIEQAAYTWFNRLIAIMMLEMNGYEDEAISFREGTHTPMLLQSAKRGSNIPLNKTDQALLKQYMSDDDDDKAFGLLLTDHCNRLKLVNNIFGSIDDFTELLLPNNLLSENGIVSLINDDDAIDPSDFKEVELIGWLYQFYIADRKNEVFAGFKKSKKARAEDIPAATQIFTPKWIVKYMVENTVGKIYLDFEPDSPLNADMKYLVEIEGESNTKQSLISDITQLTLLDPACGSGHILVVGFELLMKMYLEQGFNKKQAVKSILDHNLYGLDIDERAAQLARFALLIKAASFDASILSENLHVNVYAFPEAHHFTNEDLLTFLDDRKEYLDGLRDALKLLNQGKNVGSALKLEMSNGAVNYFHEQSENWKQKEASASLSIQEQSIWNRLWRFLEVLEVMLGRYTSVVANPPYMQCKNFNHDLKQYLESNYSSTKSDLCTVFIDVALGFCKNDGYVGEITMQSWMFLFSFNKLRREIVYKTSIITLIDVGWNLFDNHSFPTTAFCLNNTSDYIRQGKYFDLTNTKTDREKETEYWKTKNQYTVKQEDLKLIPDNPISYWITHKERALFSIDSISKSAEGKKGLSTGKNDVFVRHWPEVSLKLSRINSIDLNKYWVPLNKGGDFRKWYGNNETLINWRNNGQDIKSFKGSVVRNEQYYFRSCISWGLVSYIGFSARISNDGFIFEAGGTCLFTDHQYFIIGFLSTKICQRLLKALNPTINYNIGDVLSLPLIKKDEELIEEISKSCIHISRIDWDSRETSWDFQKSPLINENNSLKQSYQNWQEHVTNDFFQLHQNEEELDRIFIDIYGLQDELTPEVALKDITILQEELDRGALEQREAIFRAQGKNAIELPIDKADVMSQFISYAVGCMMGRYRLDRPGLNVAHPNPSDEELESYIYEGRSWKIDEDAIVPVMGNESPFVDDITYRSKEFIRVVWGDETLTENLNFLQECLGMDLEKFLVANFWDYHKRMYKKRPIYWLFSSKNGAFQVLTYMHRMDKYTVQKIRQNYLHKYQAWISEQIDKLAADEASLSRDNQKKLEYYRKSQMECKEYDEILKELAKQQIEFDLDDGVVVNYAKFSEAVREI